MSGKYDVMELVFCGGNLLVISCGRSRAKTSHVAMCILSCVVAACSHALLVIIDGINDLK